MKGAPRDKWVCRTFPHRLAQDLKEELRDQICEGLIQTEQACLQWLEDEERVDAPNQKLEDLWSIPLPLERGELRVWKLESVHPQLPKKRQAGGGLERVQRDPTPAEGRPPRPLEEASGREQRSAWPYIPWHRRTPTPE